MMKRLLSLIFVLTVSGCGLLPEEIETSDVTAGTTVVDAVEGDKSAESDSGLVDTLRKRTDPVAGDPA